MRADASLATPAEQPELRRPEILEEREAQEEKGAARKPSFPLGAGGDPSNGSK